MTRASELFGGGGGIHFKDPWEFKPFVQPAANLQIWDSGGTQQDSTATAFFTEMARRGLQDTTNWTADTYKTILSVPSGKGLVAAYIGCTAGGAETHTVEFTIDGVLTEITIGTLASGERGILIGGYADGAQYTTVSDINKSASEALEADKATFTAMSNVQSVSAIAPWRSTYWPCLKFKTSLLIRAKHSANITNSTATAYSAVMYRLGL